MSKVLLVSFAEDKDIIEETECVLSVDRFQCIVHRTLESARTTTQSKGQHIEFIVTNMCRECSLVLFSRS